VLELSRRVFELIPPDLRLGSGIRLLHVRRWALLIVIALLVWKLVTPFLRWLARQTEG